MVSQLLQFLNLLSFRPNQSDYTFSSIIIQKKKEIKYLPRTQLVKIRAEIGHTVDSKYSALLDISSVGREAMHGPAKPNRMERYHH